MPTSRAAADAASAAPIANRGNRRASTGERVVAAAVALACLGVLTLAWRLNPEPGGFGTHRQLGLPPCAWLTMWGFPCMTCGMTTAFCHAAHGDLVASFRIQPMGCILAVLASVICSASVHTSATGSLALEACSRLVRPRTLIGMGTLLLIAWAYTIWRHATGGDR